MAKKTNKTAHVLNLLSGNSGQKASKTESALEEQRENEPEKAKETNTSVVSSVKMDSSGKEDAVSDLIHQQLLSQFAEMENAPEMETPPEVETIPDIEPLPEPAPVMEIPEPSPSLEESESQPPELAAEPSAAEKQECQESEAVLNEPPNSEKEPEFIVLNVVEQIVRDKIIYFMRQFDVCTCERCVADTVALTLNGLKPKYLVTSPAATAPLVSFYTNKYISDITVEATKACMVVKEHPRHKK